MATIDRQRRVAWGERLVAAPPEEVFAILADPRAHARFDGSGTVRSAVQGPERLGLGDRFGMDMQLPLVGVPYRITNEVVELVPDRRIAWRHFGHHRWRYELEPVEGGTLVRETFEWSTARSPLFYELVRYPERNAASIDATLDRLASLFDGATGRADAAGETAAAPDGEGA